MPFQSRKHACVASHFVTLKKLQLQQRLFKLQDLHSMGVVWFGC